MNEAQEYECVQCQWCVSKHYSSLSPVKLDLTGWPAIKADLVEHGWVEYTQFAGFVLPCSVHCKATEPGK